MHLYSIFDMFYFSNANRAEKTVPYFMFRSNLLWTDPGKGSHIDRMRGWCVVYIGNGLSSSWASFWEVHSYCPITMVSEPNLGVVTHGVVAWNQPAVTNVAVTNEDVWSLWGDECYGLTQGKNPTSTVWEVGVWFI